MRDRVCDLSNGGTGRLAQHSDKVVVELPAVNVDPALLRQADRLWRWRHRLDKHRNRDQSVRKYQMRDRGAFAAQPTKAFDDLGEARREILDHPSGFLWLHFSGRRLPHLPVGRQRRERRLDLLAVELGADLDVDERELLDWLVLFVEQARLEQQAAGNVGPELVAISQPVLGLENESLCFETCDAGQLSLAEKIMCGERIQLLRKQRREGVAERSGLNADDLGIGVVTPDQVIVANDLARWTVQVGQLLELAARFEQVDQTRGLDPAAVLIDNGADVVEPVRGTRRALQPGGGILTIGGRNRRQSHHDKPGAAASTEGPAPSAQPAARSRRRATGAHSDRWPRLREGRALRPGWPWWASIPDARADTRCR